MYSRRVLKEGIAPGWRVGRSLGIPPKGEAPTRWAPLLGNCACVAPSPASLQSGATLLFALCQPERLRVARACVFPRSAIPAEQKRPRRGVRGLV